MVALKNYAKSQTSGYPSLIFSLPIVPMYVYKYKCRVNDNAFLRYIRHKAFGELTSVTSGVFTRGVNKNLSKNKSFFYLCKMK